MKGCMQNQRDDGYFFLDSGQNVEIQTRQALFRGDSGNEFMRKKLRKASSEGKEFLPVLRAPTEFGSDLSCPISLYIVIYMTYFSPLFQTVSSFQAGTLAQSSLDCQPQHSVWHGVGSQFKYVECRVILRNVKSIFTFRIFFLLNFLIEDLSILKQNSFGCKYPTPICFLKLAQVAGRERL